VLGILCVCSVFVDMAIRNVLPFDFYYYYPVFLLFLICLFTTRGHISLPPTWFFLGFSVICISSFIKLTQTDLLGFEFWKQVVGIMFSAIVYYNVLYVFRFDIKRIFEIYLKLAFFVALFGVFDNALHIAGIHITRANGSGLQYREYSIMGEPFYLAMALTPAIAYYTMYIKRTWKERKKEFIILLLCYLLTYSSTAVAGLILSGLFSLYFNDFLNLRKNKLILAPVLIVPFILLINFLIDNVDLINSRFNDTTQLFLTAELETNEAGSANSSTFALYSNYIIARDSFLEDPLFGSGLGSHPLIYQQTFLEYFPSSFLVKYGAQNQQDANSKFLRLMSETGLVGLGLFIFAFLRFFTSKRYLVTEELKELGAIHYSIFIYITLCLIRNGNYINVGFFLFFFIYYIAWRVIRYQAKHVVSSQPIYQAQ
jgi:hypothetical protein